MQSKVLIIISFILSFIFITSCQQNKDSDLSETEIWKLGWRMIESTMNGNHGKAEMQFDSLLNFSEEIERKFLITGLESKYQLEKKDDIAKILNTLNKEKLEEICTEQFLSDFKPCFGFSEEKVENKTLQSELIKMYINDQAARGNIMDDIINKYNIDRSQITQDGGVIVGQQNRERLKEIIKEFGFPSRSMVGKDAMYGIFLIIQHSDDDMVWQKSQLKNIENAVKKGDLEWQNYAYLYDRIQINSGKRQLYGSQFSKIDPITKKVELAPTQDPENLNQRRMEMGMMPLALYKKIMFMN